MPRWVTQNTAPVSAIRLERCPPSAWNGVRDHRGMLSAITAERCPGSRGIRNMQLSVLSWGRSTQTDTRAAARTFAARAAPYRFHARGYRFATQVNLVHRATKSIGSPSEPVRHAGELVHRSRKSGCSQGEPVRDFGELVHCRGESSLSPWRTGSRSQEGGSPAHGTGSPAREIGILSSRIDFPPHRIDFPPQRTDFEPRRIDFRSRRISSPRKRTGSSCGRNNLAASNAAGCRHPSICL
jgi:hypothetical protein